MESTQTQESHMSMRDIIRGIGTVVRYAREYFSDFKVLIFITTCLAILSAFMPYIWGLFIDSITATVSQAHDTSSLIRNPFFMLGVWFVVTTAISTLEWAKHLKQRKIEEVLRVTYRINASKHLLEVPVSYHTHHKMGETTEKITRAGAGIQNVLTVTVLDDIPTLFTSIIMIGLVFSLNATFGMVLLIGLSIAIFASFINLKPQAILQRQSQRHYKEMWGRIQDWMTNIRIVKDFTTEEYEHKNVTKNYFDTILPKWFTYYRTQRSNWFLQSLVAVVTRLLIFGLSLHYILNGNMTVGELVAVNGLVSFNPLLTLVNGRHRLQNSLIQIEEAEQILAVPTEVYLPADAIKVDKLNGAVEFENISFAYEGGNEVFSNLSFSVSPGETVAFVGESGVGKSTLIDLLSGYYFPTKGRILIDGVDNRRIPLKFLRQSTATVPQEITLFNDTILNNIRYGSFEASEKEIKEVARLAHCAEFIEKFPLKWNQLVGERGMRLSVGQKQRIAIARAMLRDPAILILDEPTSALDAHSESVITQSLETLMEGRTTFIIAHRLSTVRKADKIIVFKNGKLEELGNHKDLVEKGGEYAKLYELQYKVV